MRQVKSYTNGVFEKSFVIYAFDRRTVFKCKASTIKTIICVKEDEIFQFSIIVLEEARIRLMRYSSGKHLSIFRAFRQRHFPED